MNILLILLGRNIEIQVARAMRKAEQRQVSRQIDFLAHRGNRI